MKNQMWSLATLALSIGLVGGDAQTGSTTTGRPTIGAFGPLGLSARSTSKIFGENSAFSGSLETQIRRQSKEQDKETSPKEPIITPAKVAYLDGKARLEIDPTKRTDTTDAPSAARPKISGPMVSITRPDMKLRYTVFPNLAAYVEFPFPDEDSLESDLKVEVTELGKETVEGHPCIKNEFTFTGKKEKKKVIVWNATDLNRFPVQIQSTWKSTGIVARFGGSDGSVDRGSYGGSVETEYTTTLLFRDVKLGKPEAALFNLPSGLTRYNSLRAIAQQEAAKSKGAPQRE